MIGIESWIAKTSVVSQLCGYVVFKPMMYVVKTCIISISWEYGGFVSTLLPFQLPSIKESILISRISIILENLYFLPYIHSFRKIINYTFSRMSILLEKLRNSRIGEALLDHFIFSRKIVKLRHSADFLKNCYILYSCDVAFPSLYYFYKKIFIRTSRFNFYVKMSQ